MNTTIKIFTIVFSITLIGGGVVGFIISKANSHGPYKVIPHLSYEAIFNFGDSISDTGNADFDRKSKLDPNNPYGSTYFKHPYGRFSDGRLIIDFIAQAYGLPLLPAYLNLTKDQDIKKGVNFAYAGSIAIDTDYYKSHNISVGTNMSLSVELGWFKKFKPSLCKNKQDCDSYFKNSLFLVGEIGGNDVITWYSKYLNVTKLREAVPLIVEAITTTTIALIEEGAVELVVPGNFPMGCNAAILTTVNSTIKEDYDEFGCLISFNTFVEYFNEQLKKSIETLRQKYPQTNIIYFDYFNTLKRLYQSPQQYGFISDKNDILKACCGAGGPYNVNFKLPCGLPEVKVCPDPSKLINWDGNHLTEAAHKQIAKGLLEGPFADHSLRTPPNKIT